MRIVPSLLVALLSCAVSAPAHAQSASPAASAPTQPAPSAQPPVTIVAEPAALFIAACDADGDARVTRAELVACVARSFVGDSARGGTMGYVDYADWALKWLGNATALPSPFTVDSDGDDRITLAELQAQFALLFTRFDLDRDGILTRAELLTVRAGAGGDGPSGGSNRHGRRGR